jgi:ABC-type transport system substrate-binding protein
MLPRTAAAGPYDPDSVLYDPEAARAALAAAGYSGCVGFPQTTLLVDDTQVSRALAERLIEMWSATLGCDGVFVIDQQPLLQVEELVTTPPDDIQVQFRGHRPGLALLYWEGEYPDPHHWLADILGCREMFPDAYVNSARPCVEADEWLAEGVAEHDPAARVAQYAQIEEAFFGPQGEMPAIPLYFETRAMAFQPWIQAFPLQAGPLRFDQWVVDVTQKP